MRRLLSPRPYRTVADAGGARPGKRGRLRPYRSGGATTCPNGNQGRLLGAARGTLFRAQRAWRSQLHLGTCVDGTRAAMHVAHPGCHSRFTVPVSLPPTAILPLDGSMARPAWAAVSTTHVKSGENTFTWLNLTTFSILLYIYFN